MQYINFQWVSLFRRFWLTAGEPLCVCARVCVIACVLSVPVFFYLILTDEFVVRDVGRQICVQKGTESQAITPTAAEVGHIDILKAQGKKRKKKVKEI